MLQLNIAIHELSHAIMCLIFKKGIEGIFFGEGPSLNVKKLRIGLIPSRGGVQFLYTSLSKLESYVIFMAGPIVTTGLLIWYIGFSVFVYKHLVVLQLIIQMAIALIPANNSDLSNALQLGGYERGSIPREKK